MPASGKVPLETEVTRSAARRRISVVVSGLVPGAEEYEGCAETVEPVCKAGVIQLGVYGISIDGDGAVPVPIRSE